MQDHWLGGADVDQFGQVLLGLVDVNDPLGVIAEHAKELVYVQVNGRGLDAVLAERVDDDTALFEGLLD